MSWKVADFIAELENIQMLMHVRKSETMGDSLVGQLKDKLSCHPWTAVDLCKMMEACNASSLSDGHKETLLQTLEATASGTVSSDSAMKLTQKPQSLIHIMNYMSSKDWKAMEAGNSWDSIIIMAKRLRSLGMVALREDTKKWATALLAQAEIEKNKTRPIYDDIYSWSQSLHEAFVNLPCNLVPGKGVYPQHPKDLGQAWLQAAYGDDDKPEAKDFPGLAALVAGHIPVRSSSSLLSWNQSKPAKKFGKESETNFLKDMMTSLTQKALQADNNGQNVAGIDLKMFKPNSKKLLDVHGQASLQQQSKAARAKRWWISRVPPS